MVTDRNPLDIDVEYFNPLVARARYLAEGYTEAEIKSLLVFDAAIYARPADEIRDAKRQHDVTNR